MAPAPDHGDDEMHELNQEADYLDQTVRVDTPGVNGHKSKSRRQSASHDSDAQAQVIESLRSQIQDLFSQVSQLNNKLVRSYDRVSDLEDELHVTSDNLRNSTLKVSQLELERAQHLSALSTGLLVEKSHVTTELTRLMEKATEEAARAGEAESARVAIEKDLDDLSAGLFDQANTMVAEARLARARSERKVEETEEALRGAEEIVGVLQTQLQALQAEKEESDKAVEEMRTLAGKGKWVDRPQGTSRVPKVRLLCLHAPYIEYVQFIAHLRTVRPSSTHPPAMPSLLPQPFLARLLAEDSDPAVRLDLAPQLNWLTRRSVLAAIHSGQLSIEPMSTTTLLEELAHSSIPGNSHTHISCALCGSSIIDSPASPLRPSFSPSRTGSTGKSWTPTLLKTSLVQSITSASFGHSQSRPTTPTTATLEPPAHVFIFRLESTSSSGLPSLPIATPQPNSPARPPQIYPLCASGWCLTRLRTTCSLWAFIRTNIVEKIWEEEPYQPTSNLNSPQTLGSDSSLRVPGAEKPSPQPKRSIMGIGALWGTMSRSLSNTATKPESEVESLKPKDESIKSDTNKAVPPVPPRRLPPPPPRNLPPPPPPRHPPIAAPVPRPAVGAPPPLPQRNRQRSAGGMQQDAPTAPATPELNSTEEPHEPLLSPPEDLERFATPEGDKSADSIQRPTSPRSIPLPPSAPATPAPSAVPASEHSESSVGVATPQGDKPPVPPRGSAPPPPLPRRAAARARPVSLIPPEESAAPEHLGDAAHGSGGLATTDTTLPAASAHEEMRELSVKVDTPDEHTSEPILAGQKTPEIKDAETVLSESIESLPAVTEADSATLQDHRSETAPSIDALKEEVRETPEDTAEPVQSSKEGSLRSLEDVSLVNASAHEEETQVVNLTPETASEVATSEDATEDEPGVYVGNSSWEERTWKELVKLREEMFWARIGGVR